MAKMPAYYHYRDILIAHKFIQKSDKTIWMVTSTTLPEDKYLDIPDFGELAKLSLITWDYLHVPSIRHVLNITVSLNEVLERFVIYDEIGRLLYDK